jgi:hypothetical protein
MTNFHVILTESERDDVVTALDLAFTILNNRRDGIEKAEDLWASFTTEEVQAFDKLATKIDTIK